MIMLEQLIMIYSQYSEHKDITYIYFKHRKNPKKLYNVIQFIQNMQMKGSKSAKTDYPYAAYFSLNCAIRADRLLFFITAYINGE